MLLIQAYFLQEVLVVTKQCPNMSNNAGIIWSVSPPHLFLFLTRDSECQRVSFKLPKVFLIFSLTYPLRSQKIAVSVTLEYVLVCFFCASHQARLSVIRSVLYWFGHVCVPCFPSHWGPVNTRGARPHQMSRWKEHNAICVRKAKTVMNRSLHGSLSSSELHWVKKVGSGV